jgi:prophage antirepressor-like protein
MALQPPGSTFHNPGIRFLHVDGSPWFSIEDICTLLRQRDLSHALSQIDDDDKALIVWHTPEGEQSMEAVSEAGLRAIILSSRDREVRLSLELWGIPGISSSP